MSSKSSPAISSSASIKLLNSPKVRRLNSTLSRLKERRRQKKELWGFIVGLAMNIIGSAMGWLRCEIDQKMVDVQIDKKLEEYGLLPTIKPEKENVTEIIDTNSTKEMIEQLRRENKTRKESEGKEETEKKKEFRVPSIVLVMLTTFGRIFNVVGTMKMFQAFTSYISARRRKNLRTTTERLSGGEGEGEWSEAMMECCTLCAA